MVPKILTSCARALRDNLYEKPLHLYWKLADKIAVFGSTTQMTDGKLAAITFPMSIIIRNSARTAREFVGKTYRKYTWLGTGPLAILGAAGVFSAVSAPAAALTGSATTGMVLAGGAAAVALLPAFTLATVAFATLAASLVSVLSIVPATVNIPGGIQRSKDAIFGLKRDDDAPAAAPAATKPPPPEIDTDAATTLNGDLTFKKVKISFKKSAASPPEAPAPGVKEFKPGDAIGARKTIVL